MRPFVPSGDTYWSLTAGPCFDMLRAGMKTGQRQAGATMNRHLRTVCTLRLMLVLLLLTLPPVVKAQSYTNNYGIWAYTTTNDAISITGYSGPCGAVTIPDTINGLPVTSIGDHAFQNGSAYNGCNLSVTIPDSITSIGDYAFDDINLFSVTIGNGVTNIGVVAFAYCRLTTLTIPSGVASIGAWAFADCWDLGSVTIGNTVTSIGDGAFNECSSLTSVNLPNSVASIGGEAFEYCALTNVTIGNGVTNIGDQAFAACGSVADITVDTRNSAYSALDGVLFNKSRTTLVQYPAGRAGSYAILNGVVGIGDSAFYDCTSLTSVTIPDSVTDIGDNGFWHCDDLSSVRIGNSVTNIGAEAFSNCFGLTSLTIPRSVTSIGAGALFYGFLNPCSIYFEGNAPSLAVSKFGQNGLLTVYYLPGTTGWSNTFGGFQLYCGMLKSSPTA